MNKCQFQVQAIKRMANIGGLLPSAYQQVEYLQGSGTQYINTGIGADVNNSVTAVFQNTDIGIPDNQVFFY